MEREHHRDRAEPAGALPEWLVSWIRRTCLDRGRMSADFLRRDGELSEPSMRLVALYCEELISGQADRHGLVAEWPELSWLLFAFAARYPELTVGLDEAGWWPDSVLSGPERPGPQECDVLGALRDRAHAIVAERIRGGEESDPGYEDADGVISDAWCYLDDIGARYPAELLRLDGHLSEATARLMAYYCDAIIGCRLSPTQVRESFDLDMFAEYVFIVIYGSEDLSDWRDIATKSDETEAVTAWLEWIEEHPDEEENPPVSAADLRYYRLLRQELGTYIDGCRAAGGVGAGGPR